MTVPVHIIGGFLGSGKTTLMNHCLRTLPQDTRVALIVNDFGKVPIDGRLIERADYAMKELPSGCVCCTLSGALLESLASITEEQHPDVIVMEATGIAKPAQIGNLLAYGAPSREVHLGNVVCVIDSSTFPRMEQHLLILREQVEQSNTLVLNKTDLADTTTLEATRRRVQYLAQPDAVTVETTQGEIDTATLLDTRPNFLPESSGSAHDHAHAFMACTVEGEETYSLERITAFMAGLGEEVLRVKGIVRTDHGPRLIQGSVAGLDISEWPAEPDESRVVFVGRNFDTRAIEEALANCRT